MKKNERFIYIIVLQVILFLLAGIFMYRLITHASVFEVFVTIMFTSIHIEIARLENKE